MRSRLPVRLRGRRAALWLALGAVAAGAVAVTTVAYADRGTPAANASPTVRVRRGVVELTASAAGTVQAAQTRGLSFSTGGVVTEIDVKPGDSVTASQVLARMDASAVQDEVNAAQAGVDSAVDALTRAEQTATPGASTCQAALAAYTNHAEAVSPAPVSPSTSVGPSATPSPPAEPSSTRSEPGAPLPSGAPARPSGRPAAPGGGPTPTGGGGRPCTGPAAGSGSSAGRAGSGDSLLSAQQQLTNARLALRLAQDKLAGTTITAPVAGRVLSVAGTVGADQTPGASGFIVLGEVADTVVRAGFSEADVAHLAVGQPATVTLPNRDGIQVTGKVSQIDPAGTTSGRLVRYGVLVAFDEVPADLLLGQSADVAVVTASASDVLYAPSAAVHPSSDSSNSATVTVRDGGHDVHRTVSVGLRGDQYTEIRSGLQEGDELVVTG
ncbi:efflux RND transporter periplasmic adaptor subunit [Planosporangium mesophilum]|uniref:Multidrug resistance protein MdtA-like C-terminal permuted SH3 domain-containing protein n=1 Tax=Planosporangium mesophilum TaxID=689768 RepID=A0A8J3X0N4_9ACTN|nr:HlyD family efflux transporter periplasmic adaptor subunit [Planosporangium mesophilum]NJC84101.1 HlyD family efflux transporter periplasmic adaptor subunit [Planosporangium mesophilum]GII22896.1 hypothetical protein Pme01_24930 [Planosporangium mesophilum]